MLEQKRHMACTQPIAGTLGPFDEHESRATNDLIPCERVELLDALQTIEIEMIDH